MQSCTEQTHIAGEHWVIEFSGCPYDILDDLQGIEKALEDACQAGGLTLLNMLGHRFQPQGVTMLGLLSESHISIHTWPEAGYAAVDIFTCGSKTALQAALNSLVSALHPQVCTHRAVARGPAPA